MTRNHYGLPRYLFQIFTLHVLRSALGLVTPHVQIYGSENLVRINMRCQGREGVSPAAGQSFLVAMILGWATHLCLSSG